MKNKNFEQRQLILLALILLLNLTLSLYGIGWGLPDRWHVDESVGKALAIGATRSLEPVFGYLPHTYPILYELVLLVLFGFFFGILFLTGYPLEKILASNPSSWIEMANQFPEFATNLYLCARGFSAVLGTLAVWIIYRLAKKLYGTKTGLWSALSLSLSMGFVSANHFAKRDVLLEILFVLLIFLCVKTLQKPKVKYLYWASLTAGLCLGTKHNGLIACFPLLATYLGSYRKLPSVKKITSMKRISLLAALVLVGYLCGVPMMLTDMRFLISPFLNIISSISVSEGEGVEINNTVNYFFMRLIFGAVNYLIEFVSIFGIGLFVFVFLGFSKILKNRKSLKPAELLVLSIVFIYFFLILNTTLSIRYALTKGVLLIIPLLAIYAGLGIHQYLSKKPSVIRYSMVGLVMLYSLLYTAQADLVFARGDTRYQITEWVEKNVPKGKTIEITKQIDRVLSARLIKDYRIMFLGEHITEKNIDLFALHPGRGAGAIYFNRVNEAGPSADYIIESFEYAGEIPLYQAGKIRILPRDIFIEKLLKGEFKYKLVEQFNPSSVKLRSQRFPYFCYTKPLFWNPVPQIGYVSPTIFVFQRQSK